MHNNFFNTALQQADLRIATAPSGSRFLLDKNEQSNDVEMTLKMEVLDHLLDDQWNRYPSADNSDIEAGVAAYCGLQPENIVLGAGSASMITTLLNYFALNRKEIVITQPSYSLFDYHCKTYNIHYTPWMLTADLEYDYEHLPALNANSVLFITAPNNPVGNSIKIETLELLLRHNPDSLMVVDAVYTEFADHDFTPLVNQYQNLIVLRSFSKAFPIAGLRLGYLCASTGIAAMVRKLALQFSINPLTLAVARNLLFQPEFMEDSRQRVQNIIREREYMFKSLQIDFTEAELKVFRSEGNFLLIRIYDHAQFERVMEDLAQNGIKVLNTSNFPLLHNTFRVSIGNPHENDAFYQCLVQSMNRLRIPATVETVSAISRALPSSCEWLRAADLQKQHN